MKRDIPAEDQREREGQVGKITSVLGGILTSDSHDGKSSSEDHEHHDVQPHKGTSDVNSVGGDGVTVVSDWVVPAEEEDRTNENRPENLDENIGQDKDLPRVDFGGSFSDLVKTSLGDELRHDLLYELTEHGKELDISIIDADKKDGQRTKKTENSWLANPC